MMMKTTEPFKCSDPLIGVNEHKPAAWHYSRTTLTSGRTAMAQTDLFEEILRQGFRWPRRGTAPSVSPAIGNGMRASPDMAMSA